MFSFGEDLTLNVDPLFLLSNYKKFYKDRKEMILKFLQFFNIEQFFITLPTNAELRMLLAMKLNDNYKFLAQALNISIKTVESHRNNLKEKMNINFMQFLPILRAGGSQLKTAGMRNPSHFVRSL